MYNVDQRVLESCKSHTVTTFWAISTCTCISRRV